MAEETTGAARGPQSCPRKAGGGTWATPTTPPCVQIIPPIDPPPPARHATLIGVLSNPSEHVGADWVHCRSCVAHFPALGARRGRRLAAIAFPPSGGLCEGLWRGVSGGLSGAAGGVVGSAERPEGLGRAAPTPSEEGLQAGILTRSCCASVGPGPVARYLFIFLSAPPDSPGMAGVFPYRGPGNPVPGPLAPLPDYMSEEKLQEKGECVRERCRGPET